MPAALAIGAHTYGISVLGRAEVTGAARDRRARARGQHRGSRTRCRLLLRNRAAARAGAGVLIAGYLASPSRSRRGYGTRPDPENVRQAVRLSILGLRTSLQAAALAGNGRFATAGALLCSLPLGRWPSSRMATS